MIENPNKQESPWITTNIMKKKGVLQLALQLNFWIALNICNSLFLYIMNDIRQVARVVTHCIYTMQLITTQLQLCRNNSFSITMQLPYDYNHNVMLMSFFIYPSIFNTWHYEDFLWCFWNIDIHHPLWLFVLWWSWIMTHGTIKNRHSHIHWILETNIYIYT